MNNADNFPVDVQQELDWIIAHRAERAHSWGQLAKLSDIPSGTLSNFVGGGYLGNKENVARRIFKYRQGVESQAERAIGLPVEPGYFETPTSRRIRALLVFAQAGRITVGATGPGTGKTMTMREYQASVANCWIATMWKTDRTVGAMIQKVIRAIGLDARTGWTRQLSHQVADRVTGKHGLIVIDEANNLEIDALEELRAWHDATGVGICLLGNEELMMRIEGGPRRDAFARLNSRIAQRHVQNLPLEGDVDAFCEAWGLGDRAMRSFLRRVALTPGAGGLRECRQIIEGASMLAADDERPIEMSDLRDALSTRATRNIRVEGVAA